MFEATADAPKRSLGRRLAAIPSGRRTKWLVLILWLFIAAFAFTAGPKLAGEQQNDSSTFLPKSAESTQVGELESNFRNGSAIPAVVVYERISGITAADRAAAAADARAIAQVDRVASPLAPVVISKDGQALQFVVPIDSSGGFSTLPGTVKELRSIAQSADGLTVKVAGPAGSSGDFLQAFGDINTTLLLFTVLAVVLVLLVTYRSPFLWFVPLLAVLIADNLAQGVNYIAASNDWLVVNGQTASILLVLVFGAGTDYALLLISRYREELRRFEDRHEAMEEALVRSAGAIAASAITVAIALLTLLFSTLESTRGLGPASAIGILCALFVILTLLPTLLVVAGRWIFWPFVPRFGTESHEASGIWSRVGRAIDRRPRRVWVVTAVLLAGVAVAATGLNASGLPARESFRTTVDSVVGQQIIEDHFEAGRGTPVVVIGQADASSQIQKAVGNTQNVALVSKPVVRDGLVRFEATLAVAPDTDEAGVVVEQLRDVLADTPGEAKVGGDVAVNLDTRDAAARDRLVVIPLVLLVVLIILMILLRAFTASVMLILTVVLSFLAALGICALLFDLVLGSTRVDSNYPLFAFIFLVALGVDYNIFLMTRVREESERLGTRAGVLRGLAVTGGVITSAGIVLAATFSVLASLPITPLFQIGTTVAVGVLLDTFIVRSVLVPALSLDIGRAIWWPSALAGSSGPADDDGSAPSADQDPQNGPATGEAELLAR